MPRLIRRIVTITTTVTWIVTQADPAMEPGAGPAATAQTPPSNIMGCDECPSRITRSLTIRQDGRQNANEPHAGISLRLTLMEYIYKENEPCQH